MGKICYGIGNLLSEILKGNLKLTEIEMVISNEILIDGKTLFREETIDEYIDQNLVKWCNIIIETRNLPKTYDANLREIFETEFRPIIKEMLHRFYADKKIKHLVTYTPKEEQITYKGFLSEDNEIEEYVYRGGNLALTFDDASDNPEYFDDWDDVFECVYDRCIYDSPSDFIATELVRSKSTLKSEIYLSKLFPEYKKGIEKICLEHRGEHTKRQERELKAKEFLDILETNKKENRSSTKRGESGPDFC